MTRIIVAAFVILLLFPVFVLSLDQEQVLWKAYCACSGKKGDITELQQALDAGYPVDAIVMNNMTLLMWACSESNPHFEDKRTEVVELLLNKGANPNIQAKGPSVSDRDQGKTPLMMVISSFYFSLDKRKQQQLEIVEMLLKAGADVNIRDENGKTALQHAIESRGAKHLVNVLMQAQQKSKQ
jgi:ankyrin repeat protein